MGSSTSILHDLAHGAAFLVDDLGQPDHRIVGGIDGFVAAFIKLFALGHVEKLGAVDQFGGALARRLAGQDLLHDRGVVAEDFAQPAERIGKLGHLEIGIKRPLRKQRSSSDSLVRIVELRQTLIVGLGKFLGGAYQRAGNSRKATC